MKNNYIASKQQTTYLPPPLANSSRIPHGAAGARAESHQSAGGELGDVAFMRGVCFLFVARCLWGNRKPPVWMGYPYVDNTNLGICWATSSCFDILISIVATFEAV